MEQPTQPTATPADTRARLHRALRGPAFSTVLLLMLFAGMFWLNHHTPTWGDDWHRTLPVDLITLRDRLAWEYQSWTGRLSVLFVTYVLFWQYPGGWLVFNLLNSAVIVALIVGMVAAAHPSGGGGLLRKPMLILFLFITLWFGTTSFGEAVLWKTGAIAYLWPATAALWLMRPFVRLLADGTAAPNNRVNYWLLPWAYGLLAICLENLSAAMTAFMMLALGAAHWQGRKPARWLHLALLGQLLGSAVLLLAPGNFVRFRMQDDGEPIYLRLPLLLERIVEHLIVSVPLLPLLGVLALLALVLRRRRALSVAWAWTLFAGLTALAMLGSTGINFGTRTAFISEVFFITAAGVLGSSLLAIRASQVVSLPLLGLAVTVWAADATKLVEQTRVVAQQTDRRGELMLGYREAGLERIVLPSMPVPYLGGLKDDHDRGRFFLRDIHLDSPGNGWRNGTYAEDHGFAFANRVPRPAMIFAPEWDDAERFRPLPAAGPYALRWREEHVGFGHVKALYLHAASTCPELALRFEADGQDHKVPAASASLAWVGHDGQWQPTVCAARLLWPAGADNVRLQDRKGEYPVPTIETDP